MGDKYMLTPSTSELIEKIRIVIIQS